MTRNYLYLSLLAVGLAPAWLLSGCSRAVGQTRATAAEAPVLLDVKTTQAAPVKVPRVFVLSGTLTGNEQARVAAGAAGKVIATYVERGQFVKKGAILARLDTRTVRAQAQEAAAQVASLRAQRAQTDLDCERTQRMFDKGAIAKADYDRARTACETSRFAVTAAEARQALYGEALRDSQIRAPFSGMVVERHVSPGEYLRPDSPVATLVDVDRLRVELTVPEAELANVEPGMEVRFHAASGRERVGKVRYIGPSVREQTRDAVVEAEVENAAHDLRPGMFVTATLALGEQTLPGVPEAAVAKDGTSRRVFVVVEGRVEERLVSVGERQDGIVPVLDGVKPGERIVAQLSPDVRDGVRVK
jgi:membrane fusion protein (multidrug efflux system)